jgi:hypothetical protein
VYGRKQCIDHVSRKSRYDKEHIEIVLAITCGMWVVEHATRRYV